MKITHQKKILYEYEYDSMIVYTEEYLSTDVTP